MPERREPAQDWTCRTRCPWHRPGRFGLWEDPAVLFDRRRPHIASMWHHQLVEDYRLAAEAQRLRAEAVTSGYATEEAAYFGEDGAGDGVEKRLTFRDWLVAHSQEAQQAGLDPDALPEGWDQGWDDEDWTPTGQAA